jgi:hypothetical protein
MYVISSLTRVRLSYELGVLVENAGKFSRGAGRLSGFIGRTLQSFFLAH